MPLMSCQDPRGLFRELLGLSTQTVPSESDAGCPPSSGRASSQDLGQDLGQPQGTCVFSPPVCLSPSPFLRLLCPLGIPVGSFSATLMLVKGPGVCLANTAFRTLSLQSRRTNRRVVREKLVLLGSGLSFLSAQRQRHRHLLQGLGGD